MMILYRYEQIDNIYKKHLSELNIFYSKDYSQYIEKEGNVYLIALYKNIVMPIAVKKKFIFCYAEILSEPYCLSECNQNDFILFYDKVMEALKEYNVQWTINTAACLSEYTPHNCKRIPFGSHVINLSLDVDNLMANMHSKHRNVVKKALSNNVRVDISSCNLIDDYIFIDKQTWNRSNRLGFSRKYYLSKLESLPMNSFIAIAYHDDMPQAGALIYYNKTIGYYMYGCTIDKPVTGSANLLQWEIIKFLKAKNVKYYSFVGCRINEDKGSKYEGIQRFKGRFGGVLKKGFLFRYEQNHFMYRIFQLAMRIRTPGHTKYKDAIDQEIHKWKDEQI